MKRVQDLIYCIVSKNACIASRHPLMNKATKMRKCGHEDHTALESELSCLLLWPLFAENSHVFEEGNAQVHS